MDSRYQLEQLNSRHYKIIDLCIKGWSQGQIATHLGMGKGQISVVINSPNFQHQLAIRRSKYEDIADQQEARGDDEVTRALKEGTVKAVNKLVLSIDSADESIAVRSAAEVLDRGGYPKAIKQAGQVANQTIIIGEEAAKKIIESIELDKDKDEVEEKCIVGQ